MKKGFVGIIGLAVGAVAGFTGNRFLSTKGMNTVQGKVDKFKGYYTMLNQWLILKQEGKTLEKYFVNNQYKTVAIYGMGEMGNRLYDELKDSAEVEVKYGIDNNAAGTYSEMEVKSVEECMESAIDDVDVVVVTATFAFDEIEEKLAGIVDGDIVSLDDVVFDI